MSAEVCVCGSGKKPLGICTECGKPYCSECVFTHKYTPQPMKTADFLYTSVTKK